MEEEKNELNDIILNKGNSTGNNKKIMFAVATLGVVLIVVVMLMNSLTSSGTDNLPQAVLPPEPNAQVTQVKQQEEPLFEEVEVIEESSKADDNLDKIAQRLKQESQVTKKPVQTQAKKVTQPQAQKESVKKATTKQAPTTTPKKNLASGTYYIQVGSFSKYEPNKKFLKSITDKGFTYKYHKVTRNSKTLNKVLIGPFMSEKEARGALRTIRSSIEAGAFLTKI